MMANVSYSSPSPRVPGRGPPQTHTHTHVTAPVTPVHSPHHSVTSSASTRTPIHTLSIHEYRRQQNTPNLQTAALPGRTLRRKAAAPSLNPLQSDHYVQAIRSTPVPTTRPLHISQSAQQLHSYRSPLQQERLADQITRAQSAEPRTQGGSVSSISTTTSTGKLGHFKSRKRLPKPSAALVPLLIPTHLAPSKPPAPPRPPFPHTLDLPTESSHSSGIYTPHSASTFSLSRFPNPPHLSPPQNESERSRLNAVSYASTAPVTPPATPATLHYRGASFDLVNPHDSLVLHNIVTPSREFDSTEYLPVLAAGEPFPDFAEMAPKRALYGDFNAAHAGIMRRAGDSFTSSNLDLPLPPTPTAISPDSSTYTSPMYSPESVLAPPPLAFQKTTNDSRFSLKQLTRTLTKRLGKTPEKARDRELQQFRDPQLSIASISMEGDFPRPLQETYSPTPQSAYFPISPTSPVTPTSPESPLLGQDDVHEIELPRRFSLQRYDSEPLASLIPDDDLSTQMGRGDEPRISMSEGQLFSRPYYDDLDSIYPSSSVYTGDDKRKSNYQQSVMGTRQSNPFVRYSGMDTSSFAHDYSQGDMYGYSFNALKKSKPLSQEARSRFAGQGKTDTISKIIDQYDPSLALDNTLSMQSQDAADNRLDSRSASGLGELASMKQQQDASTLGHFEFGWNPDRGNSHSDLNDLGIDATRPTLPKMSTTARSAGAPPCVPPPLAPAFSASDGLFSFPNSEASEMFSNRSSHSYGDTRHLLQMSQAQDFGPPFAKQPLQPSSSYSQPGEKSVEPSSSYSQAANQSGSHTPQEALDVADQIFQSAIDKQGTDKGIPAMWAKRSSGSMLLVKKAAENRKSYGSQGVDSQRGSQGNEADWESIAGNSHGVRDSFDSIADYSSSEGTRNSLGLNSDGSLPSWNEQQHSQGFSVYSHPSPLRAHFNPFSSSPPPLRPRGRVEDSRDSSSSALPSSPPRPADVAVFRLTNAQAELERDQAEKPTTFAPWADQYAFSDKVTQELLASGPNDKIIIDHECNSTGEANDKANYYGAEGVILTSSAPASPYDSPSALARENTFEKMSVIGPRGNLTGTPLGTRMHETGSSVADTSSPGLDLTSSPARDSFHSSGYPGFYASPFPATRSVTTIQQNRGHVEPDYDRTPSQITMFPNSTELEPVIESSPVLGASHQPSIRNSTSFQQAQRRASRTAVPGQTKLRQMILAPETARRTLSSADTNFSRFKGGSERPSTSDTHTPLRPKMSIDTVPTVRTLIAHHHSPHLLCPERAANPEDEERRRKLSWVILAVFCLLPPCIILYRVWGDAIMVSVTKGHLGHCTNKSKKAALIGGIAVNVGIATAIVVPIAVAHALGVA
ncbi:hypothetical protein DE146DRAFT_146548 [Phaeosphaeria sp. MPI-PUGE-AT-0046c]|nr:hypothetical protein DE146DRAFT_146548 [Phaeosphaeria sp. MPI-PUGE-AT-0046c]